MNDPIYLAIDTETGGISRETSLLTAYFGLFDKDLELIDDLYLYCKPENNIYNVTGQGMRINGIDLGEHDKVAEPKSVTGGKLYGFLSKYFPKNNPPNFPGIQTSTGKHIEYVEKRELFKPLGHNVKFDILKVTDNVLNEATFNQFVSYRTLDTGTIGGFAIDLGLIPSTVNAGLDSLAKYYNVPQRKGEKHDAKEDVLINVGVYKAMRQDFLSAMNPDNYL